MESKAENGEGYYPCQLAMMKLETKMFFQNVWSYVVQALVSIPICQKQSSLLIIFKIEIFQTFPEL